MNKAMKRSLLYTFILLLTALALTATGVYAWYTNIMAIRTSDATDGHANVGMRINLLFDRLDPAKFSNGSEITFPDGTTATFSSDADWGSPENPYIISLPRHMINLYALQESGYFYDRYITQNYEGGDPATGDYLGTSVKPYFLVCETDATPACINGVRAGESIKIKPVGNDEYPFIGAIGGAQAEGTATAPNNMTSISSIIANFTVEAPDDVTDIGLFGKIGYLGEEPENATEGQTFEGSISGVSDLLLYDVKIVSEAKTDGARDEEHLWESDASNNVRYEEDHHVGILAGHIEYASITNISVYYSSDSITAIDVNASGANYLSDSGIIGLVYNLNPETSGNSIGCATGTTIAGAAKGAGNEWGASIDMKTMYDNLLDIQDNYTTQRYDRTKTIIVDESVLVDGEPKVTETTTQGNMTSPFTGNTQTYGTYTVKSYTNEGLGSITFSDRNGTNQFLYLHDNNIHTDVVKITYKTDTEEAFYLSQGGAYLNTNAAGSAVTAAANNGENTKWRVTNEGYIRTEIMGEWYYLNVTGGNLAVSKTASTAWTVNNDGTISCSVNGTTQYLRYDGSWALTPVGTYYYITDGAGHYLSGTANAVTNANSEADSVKWAISDPEGATTTISAYIGGTTYYLRGDGALSMGNTAFTWNKDGDNYYTTVQGVRYDLVYDNGWRVVPASGKKLTDGSGHWLTASTSGVDNASEADAVVWQFSSESGNTQIYTVLEGQKYYLTTNNDNALTVSTTAATWTRSGNSFHMTSGGKDRYLTYDGSEWNVTALSYFTINDGAGNYLRVTGANAFANGDENNATHFYFATENGANSSGTVYCVVGGTRYYLINNDGELETYTGTTAANRTQWQNDGSSLYVTSGTTTYAIEYDTNWHIKNITGGYLITDGNGNYLTYNGSLDNTTNSNAASRWTFSNTGTNPSGYIYTTYNGTTYYLRYNNGLTTTTNNGQRTTWANNGSNVSYTTGGTTYYIQFKDGEWVAASSTVTGYTIRYNNYYLNATSASGVGTGTSVADYNSGNNTVWFATNDATQYGTTTPNGYFSTVINGEEYYLYRNSTSTVILSATNKTLWRNYRGNNIYERITSGYNTTYYNLNYSNGWNIVTGDNYTSLTTASVSVSVTPGASLVQAVDTTRPNAYVSSETDPAPEVTVSDYSASGTDATLSGPNYEEITRTATTAQLFTREEYTEPAGETYYPLAWEANENGNDPPYVVSQKNTGYVMSGSVDSRGDIRVSYYAKQGNISDSLTNGNLDDSKIYTYGPNGRQTVSAYGAANLVKYTEAKADFQETLNSDSTNVYGLHFMNAPISMNNVVTVPTAVINSETYYNYTMPKNSIDFRLRTKGYINFFAGTYFTGNTTFFSLHEIARDANGNITSIKEISKIFGVPGNEKKAYIYQFAGESAPTLPSGYQQIFDMAWVTSPTWTDSRIYYYEIPVNGGEYALGSVEGKDGAYLMYLDIGTSAADRTSMLGTIDFVYDNSVRGGNKIVVVPDTSVNDTSLDYYVPSLAIMYTKNNDDDNEVDIGNFTVKVTRTIPSATATLPALNVTFGGSDAEHLDVIPQHSGGDTINKSTA